MANPFKLDDTVYHPIYGEGVVKSRGDISPLINVYFDADGILSLNHIHCSFEPWPAPVHERPIEDGWWIVTTVGNSNAPVVRKLVGGKLYDADSSYTAKQCAYTFHKFLGKDWK